MSFGIANFDSLPDNVKLAFEDLDAWVSTFLLREHNPDGTHKATSAQVDSTLSPTEQVEETHHWYRGPWTFDNLGQSNGGIGLRPPELTLASYNDFAPAGIDNAMILEMGLSGLNVTLTGLRQNANYKRLLILGNKESNSFTITLKHESTSSAATNRFKLPSATDVVLAPGQYMWLYYDVGFQRWRALITTQQSGGLGLASGAVQSTVVNISEAELEAMATTPKVLIAAPGAGITVLPIYANAVSLATAGYSNNPLFRFRYTGLSGNTVFGVDKAPRLDLTTPQFMQFLPIEGQFTNTAISNKGVEVSFATALTGAGSATMQVLVLYTLFTQTLN